MGVYKFKNGGWMCGRWRSGHTAFCTQPEAYRHTGFEHLSGSHWLNMELKMKKKKKTKNTPAGDWTEKRQQFFHPPDGSPTLRGQTEEIAFQTLYFSNRVTVNCVTSSLYQHVFSSCSIFQLRKYWHAWKYFPYVCSSSKYSSVSLCPILALQDELMHTKWGTEYCHCGVDCTTSTLGWRCAVTMLPAGCVTLSLMIQGIIYMHLCQESHQDLVCCWWMREPLIPPQTCI